MLDLKSQFLLNNFWANFFYELFIFEVLCESAVVGVGEGLCYGGSIVNMSEFVFKDALVAYNLVRLTKPNIRLAMFLAHFRQGFRL